MSLRLSIWTQAALLFFAHDFSLSTSIYWPDKTPIWSGNITLDIALVIILLLVKLQKGA